MKQDQFMINALFYDTILQWRMQYYFLCHVAPSDSIYKFHDLIVAG